MRGVGLIESLFREERRKMECDSACAMRSAQLMVWFHLPFKLKMSEVVFGVGEEALFRLAGTHFERIVWTKF